MSKKTLLSVLLVAVLVFAAGLGTFAWFTDSAKSNQNIESGTLIIDLQRDYDVEHEIGFGNMLPGDTTDTIRFVIKNDGTTNLGMFRQFESYGYEDLAKNLLVTNYRVRDWSTIDAYEEEWCELNYGEDFSLFDLANRPAEFTQSWYELGLKPGYDQEIEIAFKLNTDAGDTLQGKKAGLRLNVKGLQINGEAIEDVLGEQIYTGKTSALVAKLNRDINDNRQTYLDE